MGGIKSERQGRLVQDKERVDIEDQKRRNLEEVRAKLKD
jgi:hypothetical protein